MSQPSQNNSTLEETKMDPGQIVKDGYIASENAHKVVAANCLVPNEYTKVEISYVASGNGAGEIEKAVYYDAGIRQESTVFLDGDTQGSAENSIIVFASTRTPASLSQKHFKIWDAVGPVGVFFAVDGDVTVPTMEVNRSIKVDILTGDSPATMASKLVSAVDADSEFTGTAVDRIAALASSTLGNKFTTRDVDTGLEITTEDGIDPNKLNGRYFVIYRPDGSFKHVWYNVGGLGVDPSPGGSAGGIEVAIDENESESITLAKSSEAIDKDPYFRSITEDRKLIIQSAQPGPTTDIEDGTTNFFHFRTELAGVDRKIIRTVELTYDSNNNITEAVSY